MITLPPPVIFWLLILFPGVSSATGYFDDLLYGVSVISQEARTTVTTPATKTFFKDRGVGLEAYADKYFERKYRLKGALGIITYDGFDVAELIVSTDILLPANSEVSMFMGASAGLGMQQLKGDSLSDSALGLIYGIQFGGIVYLNNNYMAEAGVRLRSANIATEATSVADSTVEMNGADELYISLLMMF